jgi:hypothetical protein
MAVEVSMQKQLHKHALLLAITFLVGGLVLTSLIILAPAFSTRAARALVSSHLSVQTNKKGLANIQNVNNQNATSSVNAAAGDAGNRMHTQLLLGASR